jgi:carboxymethylenebutenolidase
MSTTKEKEHMTPWAKRTFLGLGTCLVAVLAWAGHGAAAPQHGHGDAGPASSAPQVADPEATAGRRVMFKGAEHELSGVLFEPSHGGPFPAIVEIHGINGLSGWESEVGRKLAAEGYITLAVDLFGRAPRDYGDGLRLRDAVRPHVAEDLRGAVSYLRALKSVIPQRVGTLGWCMGGGYALLLAVAEPTLAAGVIYYGPVAPPPGPTVEDLARIHAPLIAFFGEDDASLPMPEVKMFANDMRDAGKDLELHIYPDAGHGFAEPSTRPPTHGEAHAPDPAADSWQKTLTFLRTHLAKTK